MVTTNLDAKRFEGDSNDMISAYSNRLVGLLDQFKMQDVMPAMLQLLSRGKAVPLQQLADKTGHSVGDIREMFRQVKAEWDEQGQLTGFGLGLNKTPHKFIVKGHTLYTWCASDALIFVHVLGCPVRIESPCPATGKLIRIEASPEGLQKVDPAEAVVSGVIPSCSPSEVREAICQYGHFYSSAEAASGWQKEHPDGRIVTVAQEFEIARQLILAKGWSSLNLEN